jgi:ORF6N domain
MADSAVVGDIENLVRTQVVQLRGHRVLLTQQLALLYAVQPRELTQAVTRNLARFPADFMFQLTDDEFRGLKSQIVISIDEKPTRGGLRKMPYAFTEQGVAMLSSVLKSERAVAVNIEIMRTFVKLRGMLSEHTDMKRKLNALEKKYDDNFKVVFDAIHQLMTPPEAPKKRRIGFIQE